MNFKGYRKEIVDALKDCNNGLITEDELSDKITAICFQNSLYFNFMFNFLGKEYINRKTKKLCVREKDNSMHWREEGTHCKTLSMNIPDMLSGYHPLKLGSLKER